jgi:transposase
MLGRKEMLMQVERSYIKYLWKKGTPQTEIAWRTDHTRKTIRRILGEPTDKRLERRLMGSNVDRYRAEIKRWIGENISVKRMLEKVREDDTHPYRGGRSNFFERVKLIREEMEENKEAVVRFETLPAEQLQVDWGEKTIQYGSGRERTEYFFTARLKYSRWMYVEVTDNMQLETLLRCLLRSFERMGGVPLCLVFDNMKTVTIGRDKKGEPVWNETFFKFAVEMDFHPTVCTPVQANQKGSVENLVKFVKGNFLAGREFFDRSDLREQLVKWLARVNGVPSQAHGQIPEQLLQREQESLQPLLSDSGHYGLLRFLTVNREGTVRFENNEYSVPIKYIGKTLEVRIHSERIKIYCNGEKIADHPRSFGKRERIRDPEHYRPLFAGKPRAQVWLYREKLLSLDHGISVYTEKVIRRHIAHLGPQILEMYKLWQRHGSEKFSCACRECDGRGAYGADYLKAMLEGLEGGGGTADDEEAITPSGFPFQEEIERDPKSYEAWVQGEVN